MRYKMLLILIPIVAIVPFLLDRPAKISASNAKPVLGMNLSGVVDWSSEMVFVDSFKSSRPWISQKQGEAWGKGGPLEMDSRGNILKLAEGQFAEALMHVDIGEHYPAGDYVCLYEGKGEIAFTNAAKIVDSKPGRIELTVTPSKGMMSLQLRKTDPANPVKNIRVVKKEFEAKHRESPFYPDFLNRYRGFASIRFMDWQHTNNSKQVKWRDRASPEDVTQASEKGVCLELLIELANQLESDPWFCIPHLADDDYVKQFATMIKSKLNPNRRFYVEYSNETWNGQFEQARYCRDRGKEFGLSKNDYEAQLRYSAQRSVEIFAIFEQVFGSRERFTRVLATQSANPWTGTTAMDWKDAYKNADAIAIAPYFGNSFGDPKTADEVSRMSVEQLLEGCRKSIEDNRKVIATYVKEAKKRGLKVYAYEGGQHLAGYAGAENNQELTRLFHAANRSPVMKNLYLQDLKNWYEEGGDLFCVFSSVGQYSKWGSWGVMEFSDQDESKAPKMAAIRELMKK